MMQSSQKPRWEQFTHCDHVPSAVTTHSRDPGHAVPVWQPLMKGWPA
eukprot:CAMPEP_0171099402 /NCGR_PEP_ID=MMETSP0766_2-20121228/51420_1 /TAXON_ID=439317 /ORGANISM="Gambierdiscus australes, Strain CAWD 149" /LENGTH=46 /DNA_ID= /DNA_START= /DNA_END= /DNA_ORIENTATION=